MSDLRDDLRALGSEIDWPPAPDLGAAVRDALGADLPRRRRAGRATPRRRLVLAVLLVVLALPAAALAVAPVRHAIFDVLGLPHVAVQRRTTPPRAVRDPRLGTPTTLAGAAHAAGFAPVVPQALGAPARVYERDGIVSFTYALPKRLILAQARGGLPGHDILEKVVSIDDNIRRTTVAGAPALFLAAPHAYEWTDVTGPLVRSGPALVWERGDRVLRLEGEPSLARARAIAASAR